MVTILFRTLLVLCGIFWACIATPAQDIPYDSIPDWESHFQTEFPGAVSFGDVNNDGYLDVVFSEGRLSNRLYLNHHGVFDSVSAWASEDYHWSIVVTSFAWGDVDNDGFLDLACGATTNTNGRQVDRIYFNNRGILETTAGWVSKDGEVTSGLTFGDYDSDGDLDLAVAVSSWSIGHVRPNRIYVNHNGVLEDSATWASEDSSLTSDVVWFDVDDDGDLDLTFANGGFGTQELNQHNRIHYNYNGTINEVAEWISSDTNTTFSVAWGDVDNDGDFDMVSAESDVIRIYKTNDSMLESRASVQIPSASRNYEVLLGDIDLDGDLDLIVNNSLDLGVFVNDNGSFDTLIYILSNDVSDIAVADANNDQRLDIAVAHDSHTRKIFLNKTPLIEAIPDSTYSEYGWGRSVDWIDVDNDGDFDLVRGAGRYMLYKNDNGMVDTIPDWISDELGSGRVQWGDLDSDHFIDMVWENDAYSTERYIKAIYNDSGIFESAARWIITDTVNTSEFDLGDIDGNGFLDVIVSREDSVIQVYYNRDGDLEVIPELEVHIPSSVYTRISLLKLCDVDLDGDLDAALGTKTAIPVMLLENHNGSFYNIPIWQGREAYSNRDLAWGDMDGNGFPDLVSSNSGSWPGAPKTVYLNHGGSLNSVSEWQSADIGSAPEVVWADINADGFLDLVTVEGGIHGEVSIHGQIYFNRNGLLNRDAEWTKMGNYAIVDVSCADIDGDGDVDLSYSSTSTAGIMTHINHLMQPCPGTRLLPDNPPCLQDLQIVDFDRTTNAIRATFYLYDLESDPCHIVCEYSELGGGYYQEATVMGQLDRLESSPEGVYNEIIWDADADGVDGNNVQFRIRLFSDASFDGMFWPAKNYNLPVGRVDGRPRIDLLYPITNSVVADTLKMVGKIWDATNFSNYRVMLGKLPDTSLWEEVFVSYEPKGFIGKLAPIDIRDKDPGEYILRIIAADVRGKTRTADKYIRLAQKPEEAPSVNSWFPHTGKTEIPLNSPVVVQFDRQINQPSIDNNSLQLHSDIGDQYSDVLYDFKTRTLTLLPEKLYTERAFHYFIVNSGIPSQQGVALGGDVLSSFTTSDNVPSLDIDSLIPRRGALSVPVSLDTLIVYFNQPSSHKYVLVFSLESDTILTGVFETGWFPAKIPIQGLVPTTYYLIRISDSPMFDGQSDYMSYFITEDTQLPLAVDYAPDDRSWLIGLDSPVRVEFNKPMNTFSIDETSFYLTGPSGSVPGVIEFGGEVGTVATYYADEPLDAGSEYMVTLTDHIRDNIGNSITPLTWTFTTGVFGTASHDGSVVSSPGVELSFPLGAISPDIEVGLGQIPSEKIPVERGLDFAGVAYEIRPAMNLERKAILTVTLPDSLFATGSERYALCYRDTAVGSWQYIGGTQSGRTLKSSIDHLGTYGVFLSSGTEVSATNLDASLSLLPRVISPRTGGVNGRLNVTFRVAEATEVIARIYDTSGRLVKTLSAGSVAQVGENLLSWDGRNDNGEYATDGLHVVVIEAAGQKAQETFVILNK